MYMSNDRFRVCEQARKNVEDTESDFTVLCYNEEEAEKLASFMNENFCVDVVDVYQDFNEWDLLITNIHNDESELITVKETFEALSEKILKETDFKAIYGANNQKVRDNHIKNELSDIVDEINYLELNLSHNKRRISFLKHLIAMKTELIKYEH